MNSQRSSRESSSSPRTRTQSEYTELYDYLFGYRKPRVLGEHISEPIDEDTIFPRDPPSHEKVIEALFGPPVDEQVIGAMQHMLAEDPVASSRGQQSPQGKREKKHSQYECIICDQKLGTKGNLYCHVMEIHVKLLKFRCEVCGTRFTRKSSLENHEKIHFGREKTEPCPTCGNCFGRLSDLNKHIRVVHQNVRNMQCPNCDKCFPDASKLRRHMETHRENQARSLGRFMPG